MTPRYLTLLLFLAGTLALPARAQMSFQGLNLSDDNSAPKKDKKKSKKGKKERHQAQPPPPPVETAAPAPPPAAQPAPTPMGMPGLDLSGKPPPPPPPAPVVRKTLPPPAPAPLVLPGLKMGGAGVGRVRLDAVAQQYKDGHYADAAIAGYAAMQESSRSGAGGGVGVPAGQVALQDEDVPRRAAPLLAGAGPRRARQVLQAEPGVALLHQPQDRRREHRARRRGPLRQRRVPSRATRASSATCSRATTWSGPRRLFQAGQVPEGRRALKEAQRLVEMVPNTTTYFAKARFLAGTASYQDAEVGAQAGRRRRPRRCCRRSRHSRR